MRLTARHTSLGADQFGPSSWVEIPQERIDAFADATGDHQWIHVDPERAEAGPFGSTIAHGYLTLSLIPAASYEVVPRDGADGDQLRLEQSPLPGSRAGRVARSGGFEVVGDEEIAGGRQMTMAATVEREGGEKPVCVAEIVSRYYD